jgi:hypothetical protein
MAILAAVSLSTTTYAQTTPFRRQRSNSTNTEARGNQAKQTKDDLENAMDDLNRTTNRLRRKFDPTSNYLETKAQMEQVMDSARRVNQMMTKGNYGTQAEKYWAALRANINESCAVLQLDTYGVVGLPSTD